MKVRDVKTGRFISQNIVKKCLLCGKEFHVKEVNKEKNKW